MGGRKRGNLSSVGEISKTRLQKNCLQNSILLVENHIRGVKLAASRIMLMLG